MVRFTYVFKRSSLLESLQLCLRRVTTALKAGRRGQASLRVARLELRPGPVRSPSVGGSGCLATFYAMNLHYIAPFLLSRLTFTPCPTTPRSPPPALPPPPPQAPAAPACGPCRQHPLGDCHANPHGGGPRGGALSKQVGEHTSPQRSPRLRTLIQHGCSAGKTRAQVRASAAATADGVCVTLL